jgi:nitroimidazol reductase NimA-like FMN-containing flavoprotein (pyridoxamine 5'-phosphate oxidase superfamily)
MISFHPRRIDKTISDPAEMREVLHGQTYMTLAMCKDGEPYLVTMNYAYDEEAGCLYFHCAAEGKKMEYWRANPVVWGQVLEDRGYLAGQCNYAYRSVHFRGRVELLHDREEKRRALRLMIDTLEPDPAPVRKRYIEGASLDKVVVGRVVIEDMSAKVSPPPQAAA